MSTFTRTMTTLLLAIGMMALTLTIQAQTTIYVDDDAPCDPGPGDPAVSSAFEDGSTAYPFDAIQEGLDAAGSGDTVLVKEGVYSGIGNRDLDFNGYRINLISENGPYNTIIYLRREGRGVYFRSGTSPEARVEGFFIGWGLENQGGGIFMNDASNPTIVNCIIHGNEARQGGGIHCSDNSSPNISNCLITDNVSEDGGGIYLRHNCIPDLTGTEITGNYASNNGGGTYCVDGTIISHCRLFDNHTGYNGGGIYCKGNNDISNCVISNNHALAGAGIFSFDDTSTIDNCILTYNSTVTGGGSFYGWGQITNCTINNTIGPGVTIWGNNSSMTDCEICDSDGYGISCGSGSPLIENCLIAGSGDSGIYCQIGQPVLKSCIITNNHSDDYGGGIRCRDEGNPDIINCTVTNNSSALGGGGIYCTSDSHPQVTNSIFWDNDATVGPEIYLKDSGDPSSLLISYSDVEGGESAAVVETDCWLYWMWGMHSDDPLFVDPDGSDNDILTWEDNDYHLSDYSPCIEAGDPFTSPASDDVDMDGEPRLVDQWVDMGADEYIQEGAVFYCDIRCLTPVAYTGDEIIFETFVQNVTDQNQTVRLTYNIYLCTGEFFREHYNISPVPFSPYLTRTEEETSNVPISMPSFMKDCDLRYELVVSRRVSGKVLCTSSCYFQIQDGPDLQPQFE